MGTREGHDRRGPNINWLNGVRLDIVAKAATPAKDPQLYLMLRTLLTGRTGVKAHFEKREMPVYALTIAKGRPEVLALHHRGRALRRYPGARPRRSRAHARKAPAIPVSL